MAWKNQPSLHPVTAVAAAAVALAETIDGARPAVVAAPRRPARPSGTSRAQRALAAGLLALQLVAVGGLVARDRAARAQAAAPPVGRALFRPAGDGAAVGGPAAAVSDPIASGPWGEGCEGNCGGLRREP